MSVWGLTLHLGHGWLEMAVMVEGGVFDQLAGMHIRMHHGPCSSIADWTAAYLSNAGGLLFCGYVEVGEADSGLRGP